MRALNKYSLLLCVACVAVILGLLADPAFAATPSATPATCVVSVTVDNIMEWEGNFAGITLDSHAEGPMTSQAHNPSGSQAITLWINGDVTLTANTTGTVAQLTDGTDFLVTKYTLTTDGDGDPASGADAADVATNGSDTLEVHSTFLTPGLLITHYSTDGSTEVTLGAEASHDSDNVADAGSYSCTQTITATWGP